MEEKYVPNRHVHSLLRLLGVRSHATRILGNVKRGHHGAKSNSAQDLLRMDKHEFVLDLRLVPTIYRSDR